VRGWIAVVGEMEALNALANYAYEHPEDTFPQFVEPGPYLDAEAFSHPLISRIRAVANDLKLDSKLQLLVISGPNMAGKSTFIRSVGVNVVLAQAGAPVRARKMVLSRLIVTASICILDSLQGGLSRFYAEIMRLKLIDEQSRGAVPVLFLLDELLSGTNSHDRRIGTESFVRTLLARGAIGLVTTHDLALAEIAEGMAGQAANFHFEDTFENGELRFDYRLTPGVVSTTNALKLMRSVGLEV
jgi:DNA mismatch repair ATPase MutS